MEKKTPDIESKKGRLFELMTICNNANNPDPEALTELQQLIRTNPVCREIIQKQNGMCQVALNTIMDNFNGSDSFKEVVKVKCDQLREDLGYSSSNALEKLAIEQIVLCWVNRYNIEMRHSNILSERHSTETGLYWEKRLTFAVNRYNRALELLSKMRKMKLVVQVNNATNQIVAN